MNKALENLKQDLSDFGHDNLMITVKREDLMQLIKSYEKIKSQLIDIDENAGIYKV